MNKVRYLANNIALFSISNFVSKILVFLLVPLYTNVLTTEEYGVADIFQVTLLLLVPALTINIGEGALRFGIERKGDRGSILSLGAKYTLRAWFLVSGGCAAASPFVTPKIRLYLLWFIILFLTNAMYEFLVLYMQGCEQVPVVVAGSILSTLIMVSCNLLFLLVLRIGLGGYFYSQMIAFGVAALTMLLLGRKKIRSGEFGPVTGNPELEKELIAYGKPMILYSTASWVNNASDRYLVAFLCGVSVNGLYGVAYKIPAILMVFQRIFAQAWQMSATKSYKDKQSDEFFTTMYCAYHTVMVIGCSLLILFLQPIAALLFQKDFNAAWIYVPPLLISVIFGALTGFLGSINLAHKDPKAMGIATGCGAVLNVVLNLILIPHLGAMGAAIATAVSYFTMYFLALLFTRKHVRIGANFIRDYLAYALLVAEAVCMIVLNRSLLAYIGCSLIVLGLILMHGRDCMDIWRKRHDL